MSGVGKVLKSVLSIFTGGKPPKVPDPKVAPDPDEKGAAAQRLRTTQRRLGNVGREGTALSQGSQLG